MLRTLVGRWAAFWAARRVLLVSGGMIASDTPGGRPDLGELGIQVGKEAALANTTIYTLYIESSFIERFSRRRRGWATRAWSTGVATAMLMGRWLEQFSGAAGGALFSVQVGNAESALARIQTELSSYYLLGVEPGDEDRDGRTHEIAVKTTQPNVTIRGRRWVTVPKRTGIDGERHAAARPHAPEPATPAPPAPAPPRPCRRESCRPKSRPSPTPSIAATTTRSSARSRGRTISRTRSARSGCRTARGRTIRGGRRCSRWRWRSPDFAATTPTRAKKAAGCWPNTTPACASRADADAFECSWFLTEVGRARRTLPARQRHALHPASAAALPHDSPASPGVRVRVRAAVAARRTHAGAGAATSCGATKRR